MSHPLHGQKIDLDRASANEELEDSQLEAISGGIIIVGGLQAQFAHRFNSVMLNPQPLPPRELWRSFF
jgi:hypothetical protein